MLAWVVTLAGVLLGGFLLGRWSARRSRRRDLERLRRRLLGPPAGDAAAPEPCTGEVAQLAGLLEADRAARLEAERERHTSATGARLERALARLAHDIRSPLAAVEVFLSSGRLSAETREQILMPALGRLRSIAGMLTDPGLARDILTPDSTPASGSDPSSSIDPAQPQPLFVAGVIDAVVSSLRRRGDAGIGDRVEWDEAGAPYGLFVHLAPSILRPALEELAAAFGSIAPLGGAARLRFRLTRGEGDVDAVILLDLPGASFPVSEAADAGAGPLETALEPPAARLRRALGPSGRVVCRSGREPKIEVVIPATAPPSWFLSELGLPAGRAVVVVDDDPWVHHMWERVLRGRGVEAAGSLEVIHLASLDELSARLREPGFPGRAGLYLIDDNYRGSEQSGLDLLERFAEIVPQSVLVTGRWEDPQVRGRSVALGLRLLPKHLAPRIPLASATGPRPALLESRPDAVLVDDHIWIRKGWELSAAQAGRRLLTCATMQEFLARQAEIDRATVLFIDSDLRDELPGERFAWSLFEAGFRRIYLATGFDPERFPPMPWLRGVIGKDPPDWSTLDGPDDDPLAWLAAGGPESQEG